MAQVSETRHHPGNLKQQNKAHKSGRHRTKGDLNRECHGRVSESRLSVKSISKRLRATGRQAVRRNQAKQHRKQKRESVLEKKRQRGGQYSPPHFVLVIGLSKSSDCVGVVKLLSSSIMHMDGRMIQNAQGILHASIAGFRQRISFYIAPTDDLWSLLDAAKVADSLLFVISSDHIVDDEGDYRLQCLMGQGVPSTLFVCHGMIGLKPKKIAETRKMITKLIEKRFPLSDGKIHCLDTEQESIAIVRKLTEGRVKAVHWREVHPHLIAESFSFEAESPQALEGTLKVSGYLRGAPLSADRLLHVLGLGGTYQIKQIDSSSDPHPLLLHKPKLQVEVQGTETSGMAVDEIVKVLAKPDPTIQISLDSEAEVDAMNEEQTWPTAEELAEADESAQRQKDRKLKGVSEYQASWMFDSDFEVGSEEDEAGDMAVESGDDSWESCDPEDDAQSVELSEGEYGDDKYDLRFDLEAEQKQLQQMREERENAMFPDEVETPHDMPARQRFAKYRGLESFRTSPWDKDEDLPADYQRIHRLGDIRQLKRQILKSELTNSVEVGQYITVHITGVPKAYMDCYKPGSPVVVFGLLPCEQLMSVVHFAIKRNVHCAETIKSKTQLIFQVGYRRFSACPIFSQHRKGDKHKMEKFMPREGTFVASVIAPITFGPCPVLIFTADSGDPKLLVASGTLLSADPDRIILKRLILSGDQFKMNAKKSVVRFMFFNREDIEWFKKVELRTKWHRRGRILEPLGTHGHMKCHFSGQARSQDVVLMYLYKRVFPKWTYQPVMPTMASHQSDAEEAFKIFD